MAIEYGMSADEFWKDDPQLFVSYRTSFVNKKKREYEENDYNSWLNGLYTYDGNSKLAASIRQVIHNGFASFSPSAQKDKSEIESYTKKPYTVLEKEKKQPKETSSGYKKYQESLMYFGSIKQIYLNRLDKKEG